MNIKKSYVFVLLFLCQWFLFSLESNYELNKEFQKAKKEYSSGWQVGYLRCRKRVENLVSILNQKLRRHKMLLGKSYLLLGATCERLNKTKDMIIYYRKARVILNKWFNLRTYDVEFICDIKIKHFRGYKKYFLRSI